MTNPTKPEEIPNNDNPYAIPDNAEPSSEPKAPESKEGEGADAKGEPEVYTREQVEEVVRTISQKTADSIIKRERTRAQQEIEKVKGQIKEDMESKGQTVTKKEFENKFDEWMSDPDFQDRFYAAVDQIVDKRERTSQQTAAENKKKETMKSQLLALSGKEETADAEKVFNDIRGDDYANVVNASLDLFDNGLQFLYTAQKFYSDDLRRISQMSDARQQGAELARLESRMRAGKKSTGAPHPLSNDSGGTGVGSGALPAGSLDLYNHPVFLKKRRQK